MSFFEEKNQPPKVSKKRHEKTQAVMKRLVVHRWPTKGNSQLETAVDISLKNYQNWRMKLRMWLASSPDCRAKRFGHYLYQHLPTPAEYVEQYLLEVRDWILHWKRWDGKLIRWTWKPESQEFQRTGREASLEYAGSVDLWEILQGALNENK